VTGTTRRARTAVIAGCVVAAIGAGASVWAVLEPPSASSAESTEQKQHTTVPVTKGDLIDAKVFAGSLGYGAAVGVPGAAAGTLTALPTPGSVIHRDEQLYAVDERPVRSMHGRVPLWRDLARGLRGEDIAQLNANLAALGYDVALDDQFGPRTDRAVRKYQKDRKQRVTGVLTADDIAFVDGDVRVAAVVGTLGQPAAGDVIRVTSTSRVVSANVSQQESERLSVGSKVTVSINGVGEEMPGEVVDAVPAESDKGAPTVDVTIHFDAGDRSLPPAASVQIGAHGATEEDVLSVPVSALIAGKGEGDYAVEVARPGGSTKRVPVKAGFVAAGRVAVTGAISEGDRVVVPS
jgi:peptidoglycan hydrolase-like protein with peptidoglycan-binding domain